MACDNCGQPIENDYVDARIVRHSGDVCICTVCEQCGERYDEDDHRVCGG